MSVELTGFDKVELLETGVVDLYLDWLAGAFPDLLPELLDAWKAIASEPDREQAVRRAILSDAKLGPFARAVIVLWYTATWFALPADWSKRYGKYPEDENQVFGAAYLEGLVWKAGHLHPTAGKPTGFGSWALAPPR